MKDPYRGIRVPKDRKKPGSRSARSKALAVIAPPIKLTDYEKSTHKCNIRILVEKKNMDGEETICFQLERDSFGYDYGKEGIQNQPLDKVYTDADAFGKCVAAVIKEAAKVV